MRFAILRSELKLESETTCCLFTTTFLNMSFKIRKAYVHISATNLLLIKRIFGELVFPHGG